MDSPLKKTFALAAGAAVSAPLPSMADAGFGFASVASAAPLLIPVGLLATAAIWFIMRTMPPKPRQEEFPAVFLLRKVKTGQQKPADMPLWQRLMRATALTLATLGMAQIYINPDNLAKGSGTIVIAVNNGAFSGPNWDARSRMMSDIIERAGREDRKLILLPTAPAADGAPVTASKPMSADEAKIMALELRPQPWREDNEAALTALQSIKAGNDAAVIFMDDGVDSPGKKAFLDGLENLGHLSVIEEVPLKKPHLLMPADNGGGRLAVTVLRPDSTNDEPVTLTASDDSGRALAQVTTRFEKGQDRRQVDFDLPPEIRKRAAVVSINGENGAGATFLLDENTHPRSVGVVDAGAPEIRNSLLSETLYITESLRNRAALRHGSATELFESKRKFSVIVLPDSATISKAEHDRLEAWVREGGTLLRFSGPVMAAQRQERDTLLPVEIRPGTRMLGAEFSGNKPGYIKEFNARSPFNALNIPENVTVRKQVLAWAENSPNAEIWAQLDDNTPLVTAARHGKGQIVLFHSAIDKEWMDLHLSGNLFISMMQAIVARSQNAADGMDAGDAALPPLKILDGRGKIAAPAPNTLPLTAEAIKDSMVGPNLPPGLYGDYNSSTVTAHNLYRAVPEMKPSTAVPDSAFRGNYNASGGGVDLAGALIMLAMALAAADYAVLLRQRGVLTSVKKQPASPPQP